MRIPMTRHALAAVAGLSLVMTALAPAAVAAEITSEPVCRLLLHSTPPVTADLDGDGYPDAQARIHDVTLCSDAGVSYATFPPQIERCDAWPSMPPACMVVRITVVPVEVAPHASAELCYSVNGSPSCRALDTPPPPQLPRWVMCIGYDMYGGHPCTGGTIFAFE